jgi:hypothetical protein
MTKCLFEKLEIFIVKDKIMNLKQALEWSKKIEKLIKVWSAIIDHILQPFSKNYKVISLIFISALMIFYKDSSTLLLEVVELGISLFKSKQSLK